MKYEKPALTIEQQVELLRGRGVEGDPSDMAMRLEKVNYHRLSGYAFPFRNPDDTFRPGTTFRMIWEHYVFDRRLRLLVTDALERIEVAVRTRLSYEFGHALGAMGYANTPTAIHGTIDQRAKLLDGIRHEVIRARDEQFLKHFFEKYGDEHNDPPVWVTTDLLSFGNVVRLVDQSRSPMRAKIAGYFGLSDEVGVSWFRTLNFVRNVCAQHSRLWNRVLPLKPKIPRENKYPDWHVPVRVPNDRLFTVLTQCVFLLKLLSPGSSWKTRLLGLLEEYPEISRQSMGFPNNWQDCPIWKETLNA